MNSAVSCAVKALVEATPISGPACVMIVPAASRVTIEPTTLQMASVFEPLRLASRCAASVSAVSPDCVITIVSVFGSTIGVAITELAAVIHFHGQPRQALDHELAGQAGMPTGAAGQDLDMLESAEFLRGDIHFVQEDWAGILAHPAQTVSRTARGCSKISFSMKCLKPPFSAMIGSQVMCCTLRFTGGPRNRSLARLAA